MASQGPLSGTSENIDRDGKQEWTNPTNADSQSDSYANIDITAQNYTDWIRTPFAFDIPIDAVIDGILVEIDHYGENGNINEHSCRLVLNGIIQGDEKMTIDNAIPSEDLDVYESYGGAADNWNAGLTYDEINDATFGVQVSYFGAHSVQPRNVYVDHIRMTVYYTIVGAGWSGTVDGVINPSHIDGIAVANVNNVDGV